jgi:phage shock protein PspC (stress-responsive transcriptional regulator)
VERLSLNYKIPVKIIIIIIIIIINTTLFIGLILYLIYRTENPYNINIPILLLN